MEYRRGLLRLLEDRPRSRGSKRNWEELKRLGGYAKEVWEGMEALGWVEWKEGTLIVRKL